MGRTLVGGKMGGGGNGVELHLLKPKRKVAETIPLTHTPIGLRASVAAWTSSKYASVYYADLQWDSDSEEFVILQGNISSLSMLRMTMAYGKEQNAVLVNQDWSDQGSIVVSLSCAY